MLMLCSYDCCTVTVSYKYVQLQHILLEATTAVNMSVAIIVKCINCANQLD